MFSNHYFVATRDRRTRAYRDALVNHRAKEGQGRWRVNFPSLESPLCCRESAIDKYILSFINDYVLLCNERQRAISSRVKSPITSQSLCDKGDSKGGIERSDLPPLVR